MIQAQYNSCGVKRFFDVGGRGRVEMEFQTLKLPDDEVLVKWYEGKGMFSILESLQRWM
jgi:hypothetical protein